MFVCSTKPTSIQDTQNISNISNTQSTRRVKNQSALHTQTPIQLRSATLDEQLRTAMKLEGGCVSQAFVNVWCKIAQSDVEAITYLDLRHKSLDRLPSNIGQLTNLTQLYLVYNDLTTLPAEIGNLVNLEILDLSLNLFTTLPAEIGQLTNLVELDLSHNERLTSLPKEIEKLVNLKTLYLPSTFPTGEYLKVQALLPDGCVIDCI